MKTVSILGLLLALAVPSLAATTWPASTNANQTFFGANSFSFPITLLSSTASTIQKADSSKGTASVANGTGALTNNGAGLFGWYSDFASLFDLNNVSNVLVNLINNNSNALLTQIGGTVNTYSNNVNTLINSTSNSILSQIATSNTFNQVNFLTNATMAPDFSKGYAATNVSAGFTFLSPLNVDPTKKTVQTAVVRVDNTSGSPIVILPPANVFVISNSFMGVGANGTTWFTFVSYPPDRTNVYASAEAH